MVNFFVFYSFYWIYAALACFVSVSDGSKAENGEVHVAASLTSESDVSAVKALVRSTFQTSLTPASVTFHVIFDQGLPKVASFELLESWVSGHGGTIVYHKYNGDDFHCNQVSKANDGNFISLALDKILPGVEEVIYLNADVIVAKDICGFYSEHSLLNNNEFVISAFTAPDGPVGDVSMFAELRRKRGIRLFQDSLQSRFHNGVLLLNLKSWRALNISDVVQDTCNALNKQKLLDTHWTDHTIAAIYKIWGKSLNNSLILRNLGTHCPSPHSLPSATFLQWDGAMKPWLPSTARNFCQRLWAEFSEGSNTKYLFRFHSVLFIGFTAPLPQNSSEYFNKGPGTDWIARLPQFVASNSNATVYVCESGRIIKENLGREDSSVHKLVPKTLVSSKCGSISVSNDDARLLKFDLVVVRQTAEIGLMRRIFGNDPPKFTAIFPLQYRLKKKSSNCKLLADVCIPDNYLFKGLVKDVVKKCAHSDRRTSFLTHANKKKLLLFPAKIYPRKGQYEFLESIRAQLLQQFTIRFIGPKSDPVYADKVANICNTKNLSCEFSGRLPQEDILKIFKEDSVYGVVSFGFGEIDPNPRIVGESLSCGIPVLVGPTTLVPEIVETHFPSIGSRIRNLDEANDVFAEWISRNFSITPTQFYRDHGSEKTIYESLFMNIYKNSSWRTGWAKVYPEDRMSN